MPAQSGSFHKKKKIVIVFNGKFTMNNHFIIFSAVLLCVVTAIALVVEPSINTETSINNEGSNGIEESKYRLPRNTAPRKYAIELDPNINGEEFTFNGKGIYTFEVLESTRTITLHKSSKIEIDKESIELVTGGKHPPQATFVDWDQHNEFYTIKFDRELEPRNYSLNINWSGRENGLSGFIRIKYDDDDGNTK